jgi:hypothetical protein
MTVLWVEKTENIRLGVQRTQKIEKVTGSELRSHGGLHGRPGQARQAAWRLCWGLKNGKTSG